MNKLKIGNLFAISIKQLLTDSSKLASKDVVGDAIGALASLKTYFAG